MILFYSFIKGATIQAYHSQSEISANLARLQTTIVMAVGATVPNGKRNIPKVSCASHLGFHPGLCTLADIVISMYYTNFLMHVYGLQ